jgi:hypothetical protein
MGCTAAMQIDRLRALFRSRVAVLCVAVGLTSSCIGPTPIQESHLKLFDYRDNADEIMSVIEACYADRDWSVLE